MKTLLIILVLAFALGCDQYHAFTAISKSQAPGASSQGGGSEPVIVDNVPSCVVDLAQVKIDGNVNSFEFKSGFGIVFGYNPGGDHSGASGQINLKIADSQMDLTVLGSDPLSKSMIASANVGSKQTNTNIGVNVDFNQFNSNPNYFFQTPLSKVSEKALMLGLAGLVQNLKDQSWTGRVTKMIDPKTMIINAGSRAGLKAGDQFEIYNVDHFWSGEACNSSYLGSRRNPTLPVAVIEVIQANLNDSVVTTTSQTTVAMRRGSEVIVKKLVAVSGQPARTLKKKAAVGKIQARPLQLPGAILFDLESVINVQILDVLNRTDGFVF